MYRRDGNTCSRDQPQPRPPAVERGEIGPEHGDATGPADELRRGFGPAVSRRSQPRGERRGGRGAERGRHEIEAVRADAGQPRPGRGRDQLRLFVRRQPRRQQMDVPQPQQIDFIVVMRDAVQAGHQQRVGQARAARRGAERGHRHGARPQLVERQRVAEEARIRDPPVDVEMARGGCGAGFDVVPLRGRQLRRTLRGPRPALRHEHALGRLELPAADQQVGVDSRTKVRRGIDQCAPAPRL